MADLIVNVFRLTNARYFMTPKIEFQCLEKDTGLQWHVVAGGSRAYLCRFGAGIADKEDSDVMDAEAAESHFMMSSLQGALLLGGRGLFQAEAVGRLFLSALPKLPEWVVQLNATDSQENVDTTAVYDWMGVLVRHTMLRRAAADAHLALSHPHEPGMFVYRGFERLVLGEGRRWVSHATKGLTRYGTNDRISRDYCEFEITATKTKLPADVHSMLPAMCDNFSGSES